MSAPSVLSVPLIVFGISFPFSVSSLLFVSSLLVTLVLFPFKLLNSFLLPLSLLVLFELEY